MKHALPILVLLAAHAPALENALPAAWPAARYEAMVERSPFALATPVTQTAAPQASFAANWYVSGVARIGDQDFVTIKAHDLSAQFSLLGREANLENGGVSIASVNWSDRLGKTTVILKKGTETAELKFDESLVNPPPAVMPQGGPGAAKPGAALMPVTGQRPFGAGGTPLPGGPRPAVPLPRPTSAPVVVPPTVTAPGSPAGQPPGSGENRRRIRSIAAPQ